MVNGRIPEKLQDFLDTLSLVQDRSERIQYLISLAESFKPPPEEIAKKPFPEERRVPGCESEAFEFSTPRPDGTRDTISRCRIRKASQRWRWRKFCTKQYPAQSPKKSARFRT